MYEKNLTKKKKNHKLKNLQKNWQTKLIKMTVWFCSNGIFFLFWMLLDQLNLTTIEIEIIEK